MILNLFRYDKNNAGDYNCSPLQYFDFNKEIGIVNTDGESIKTIYNPEHINLPIIIGGGGIFYDLQANLIENLCYKHKGLKIVWGAGFNFYNLKETPNIPYYFKKINYIGMRDNIYGIEWVPCASCMSNLLDKKYDEKFEIGILEHHESPIKTNLPKIDNSKKIEEILYFIGSCKKIITNSYHGYYWSVLMNKEVNIMPLNNSSKFFNLKYKVPVTNHAEVFYDSEKYNFALKECRESNIRFYNKILNFIGN